MYTSVAATSARKRIRTRQRTKIATYPDINERQYTTHQQQSANQRTYDNGRLVRNLRRDVTHKADDNDNKTQQQLTVRQHYACL